MAYLHAQYAKCKCNDHGHFLSERDLDRLDDIYWEDADYQLRNDVDRGNRGPKIELKTKASIYTGSREWRARPGTHGVYTMSTISVPRNGNPTLKCKSEERSNCPCDDSNGRQETCLFV